MFSVTRGSSMAEEIQREVFQAREFVIIRRRAMRQEFGARQGGVPHREMSLAGLHRATENGHFGCPVIQGADNAALCSWSGSCQCTKETCVLPQIFGTMSGSGS